MNLAIDIGNTHAKAAVFDGEQLVETFKAREADREFIETVFASYPGIERAIVASSGRDCSEVEREVGRRVKQLMKFGPGTAIPIKNLYATPLTLGADRLAAAVGANRIYPDNNVMIVDFGTAITIDLVTNRGEFLGGNISPGVESRFRALHEHTSSLPLCSNEGRTVLLGSTSQEAICSGVVNGILYEIEGYIARLENKYEDLRIIFTGGDGKYFAERLKSTIFATYDLVVHGLNRIMEYNAN